ncbi:flagellin N-terminal helical domain-containing protein [Rhizobium sp. C1]|uniref:flagellin N-terminal helical domain-containing protein n=1 Tax=Rhizobium sp. C1 TaxID=1349799 RepID=UPI001E3FEBE8|nr:flagellin [Rhizobium sp. C1]MCD2179024.1 flagellin [Rhizobium sp. C1]
MTSIMTNSAAMSALQTLRGISSQMDDTQSAISSGLRVSQASDNAAYWSIATTMRSDNKALSTVSDALGLAAAKTDTAYTGLNASISVVDQIKSKLVAAREPGVDKTKINSEITELKSQLTSISKSATFSGENWLYNTTGTAGTKEMVGSFTRDSTGNVAINTLKFNANNSVLIDTGNAGQGILTKSTTGTQSIANSTGTTTATYYLINANSTTSASGTEVKLTTGTSAQNIEGMVSAVDTMLKNMTATASTLGAVSSRVDLQNNFVTNLQDVISKGVGRLVDADMNEESTKLKALQTQQQLGIQALSIANSDSQSVLSLFR